MIWIRNAVLFVLSFVLAGSLSCRPEDPRVERFDCQVRALQPLVGSLLDAREVVQQAYVQGNLNLSELARNVGKGQEDVAATVERLRKCDAPTTLPDAGLAGS